MSDNKIIVALDYDNIDDVNSLCKFLNPENCRLKVGKQLFTRYGRIIIDNLHEHGFEVFLDLKFHDIPITVYKASKAAFELGIWMLNIHILGGEEMISAAVKARDEVNKNANLIGVTALTSLGSKDLSVFNFESRTSLVRYLSKIAFENKLNGIVCSPGDIASIDIDDKKFKYITPGIRLDQKKDDHDKTFSPQEAIKLGSDYLVLGRALTLSKDPELTIKSVIECIK